MTVIYTDYDFFAIFTVYNTIEAVEYIKINIGHLKQNIFLLLLISFANDKKIQNLKQIYIYIYI